MDLYSVVTLPLWVLLVVALAGVLVGEFGLILLLAGLDKILPRRREVAHKRVLAPTPEVAAPASIPAPVSRPPSPVPVTRPDTVKTKDWRVSVGKSKK